MSLLTSLTASMVADRGSVPRGVIPVTYNWSSCEKKLNSMSLWRSRPNTGTLPAILLTLPPSKAAGMVRLCVPQNQALGVCSRHLPYIQVCGPYGREDLVNATVISNAEDKEEDPRVATLSDVWCYWVSARIGWPVASVQ